MEASLLAPRDGSYYEMVNRFVQSEVDDYPDTAYMRGLMAAIGIAKGQEFEPTDRQRELLDYAAQTAWKMAKVVAFDLFEDLPKAKWYPDGQWLAHVRNGGDDLTAFLEDIYYQVDGEHYIDLDAQLHIFINAYSMSPGMITSTPGVGAITEAVRQSAVPPGDVFVTTKLWISDYGYDEALHGFERSMRKLGLQTLDLYLLHQPMPTEWERTVAAWNAAGRLLDEGRTLAIGVSNFSSEQLDDLIDRTGVVPLVNQVELHPFFTQEELRAAHARLGIATQPRRGSGDRRARHGGSQRS